MNKCAKFHKDSPSGKKLNSISGARLNFRRRPILCTTIETLWKRAASVAHFTNFSFEFFYEIFTEDAFLLFYTMVQKSQKWPKTQIKGGGSCLKVARDSFG